MIHWAPPLRLWAWKETATFSTVQKQGLTWMEQRGHAPTITLANNVNTEYTRGMPVAGLDGHGPDLWLMGWR